MKLNKGLKVQYKSRIPSIKRKNTVNSDFDTGHQDCDKWFVKVCKQQVIASKSALTLLSPSSRPAKGMTPARAGVRPLKNFIPGNGSLGPRMFNSFTIWNTRHIKIHFSGMMVKTFSPLSFFIWYLRISRLPAGFYFIYNLEGTGKRIIPKLVT